MRSRPVCNTVMTTTPSCVRHLPYGKIPRTPYTFPMFDSAAAYAAVRMSQPCCCAASFTRCAAAFISVRSSRSTRSSVQSSAPRFCRHSM